MEAPQERSKILRVRLTPAEWQQLQERAREQNTNVSEFVRQRVLVSEAIRVPHPTGAQSDALLDWLRWLLDQTEENMRKEERLAHERAESSRDDEA